MRVIAHRGNVEGPNPSEENKPEYIVEAIENGFEVEVDIWAILTDENQTQIYLGHDRPKYLISWEFIKKYSHEIWFHAKNLMALEYCLSYDDTVFWHQKDERTLVSNGKIWTYPDCSVGINSVLVLNEHLGPDFEVHRKSPLCYGVCTDFAKAHRLEINKILLGAK